MKKIILLIIAVVAVGFLVLAGKGKPPKDAVLLPLPPDTTSSTLRKLAEERGIKIGSAINEALITTDQKYIDVVKKEFSAVTPENFMKWEHIHPEQNRYDYQYADVLAEFAKTNNMVVRGHALVHADGQLPKWLKEGNFSGEELAKIMQEHIRTVLTHYKEKFPNTVIVWDVVNESFLDDGSWRTADMIWSKIGPSREEYVKIAFRTAGETDSRVKLFYNDNGIETINPKSDATYNFIKALKEEGVPIDGIGFQSHIINTTIWEPALDMDLSSVEANFKRFADLGLEIQITELDVPIKVTDGVTQTELDKQAKIYETMVKSCLKVKKCTMIITWGFTDKSSWWPSALPTLGAALPFDQNYNKKPAYFSIYNALQK